jgi:LacI family repressor for deo operon, udp, cdd, tsx, nupC, and nupG
VIIRKPQATIQDVATELGLSVATVSRALTKPELLKPETRNRVLEVVERLNYRPNLIARGLRTQKTKLIFVVVPRLSPFFLDVLRGAQGAAEAQGFSVLMGHTERSGDQESAFIDQVLSQRADGIILVTSSDTERLAARQGRLPPMVAALDGVDGHDLPTVRVDNEAAADEATTYLINLGHRRIAHIGGPAGMNMADRRRIGFERAMRRAGLNPDTYGVECGDFSLDFGEQATARFLAAPTPPTAIFAANDEMAVGALLAIRRAGLKAGRDVSVVGFDDQRIASLYEPSITTVHVPTAELGRQAMLLMAKILAGETTEREIVLPTHVVERRTTGRPVPEALAS